MSAALLYSLFPMHYLHYYDYIIIIIKFCCVYRHFAPNELTERQFIFYDRRNNELYVRR